MSGAVDQKTGQPLKPNDPLKERIFAPQIMLDFIANHRLQLCKDATHRVGVISFGEKAEDPADILLTALTPVSLDEWIVGRESLQKKIVEKKLGSTDHTKAFEAAKAMLEANPPPAKEPYARKRAIILLTDGQPCPFGWTCSGTRDPMLDAYMKDMASKVGQWFPFDDALRQREDAFRAAAKKYNGYENIPDTEIAQILATNDVGDDLISKSIYIWIVALNDERQPYLQAVGEDLRKIANTHGGDLIDLKQNLGDIPLQFNRIMAQLTGVKIIIPNCSPIGINPYFAQAILNVYKSAQDIRVEISLTDKNNQVKKISGGQGDLSAFGLKPENYKAYGTNETYHFILPPGGIWQVNAPVCDAIKTVFQTFQPVLEKVEPKGPVPAYDVPGALVDPDPKHQAFLTYKVKDRESGLYLEEAKDYPLDLQAEITGPDKRKFVLQFGYVAADKTWKSKDPIPTYLRGDYTVKIVKASAQCVATPLDPKPCQPSGMFEIFDLEDPSLTSSYTVGEVKQFKMEITRPLADQDLAIHGSLYPKFLALEPVTVDMRLKWSAGDKPAPFTDVMSGQPDSAFQVTLTVGKEKYGPFDMKQDAKERDLFSYTFKFDKVNEAEEAAALVEMKGSYQWEKVRPEGLTASVSFDREDPLWQKPVFWNLLAAALGVLILVAVIIFIDNANHALKGRLVFNFIADGVTSQMTIGRMARSATFVPPAKLASAGVRKLRVVNKTERGAPPKIELTVITSAGPQTPANLASNAPPMPMANLPCSVKYEVGGSGAGASPTQPRPGGMPPRPNQPPRPNIFNRPRR